MGAITFQITSRTIVFSTVYSSADERIHHSSASLAFVMGIHRCPVNSPHKWPVTRKMFPWKEKHAYGINSAIVGDLHQSMLFMASCCIWRRYIESMLWLPDQKQRKHQRVNTWFYIHSVYIKMVEIWHSIFKSLMNLSFIDFASGGVL